MTTKKVFQGTIKMVPTKELLPDPDQPRQDFDEKSMEQLKDSISDKGIMNPITVEPKTGGKYLIVDGERRYRTAITLKISEVPVNILPQPLNEFDRNIIRFQLQETHKQWSPFEKAEAMARLKEFLQVNNSELAKALAVTRSTCDRYLSLLNFPVGSRKKFIKAKLPLSVVVELSYTVAIMPEKIVKEIPDFIDKAIEKYKRGYIFGAGDDFRVINKLIKIGQYKYVVKFFKQLDYTATNAASDSGLVVDNFINSIGTSASKLTQKINVAITNEIKLPETTAATLNELKKAVNKL